MSIRGPIDAAKLVAITPDGGLTLDVAGSQTTFAPDQLVSWGKHEEARRGPLVVLSDGSLLVAHPIGLSSEALRVDARLFGELALSRSAVRGVIFRLPAAPGERDALLERIVRRRDPHDLLLLANGDELTGRATGQKYEEGDTEERLLFAVGQAKESAAIGLSNLAALAFDTVLIDDATPRGRHTLVGLRDGSELRVESVSLKAGRYELALASGIKLRLEADAIADDIAYWQPLGTSVAYLSDLRDAGYKHIPFLTQAWPYFNDRNCHGHRLRAGDALHAKGLGMRTTSRLAYELEGDDRQFAAELALDASAGSRGSVVFRVFTAGDGAEWKTAYESPVIRGGDAPLPIAVDLRGATRLALIVDFAERGDECDDADWLNARLVK